MMMMMMMMRRRRRRMRTSYRVKTWTPEDPKFAFGKVGTGHLLSLGHPGRLVRTDANEHGDISPCVQAIFQV
jgi:hypothetical protein